MPKTCFKCEETKPIDDFYRHKAMADGHLNKCKECTKKDVRMDRRISPRAREYDALRSSLPHRKSKRIETTTRYQQEHPMRKKAVEAANNAVRDGKLKREPCLFCGATENIHKHHRDYSKPLDVTWLCASCHRRLHATFPETVTDAEEALRP
jgi:hypothetical protein